MRHVGGADTGESGEAAEKMMTGGLGVCVCVPVLSRDVCAHLNLLNALLLYLCVYLLCLLLEAGNWSGLGFRYYLHLHD